ncbi:hypothetical protein, partial [Amycolatopsis solani]|uniref:hypothetical protein n=1 Tax=Amycolatopsis solani TaxID=3028615 RepID=UPI0025AF3E0D
MRRGRDAAGPVLAKSAVALRSPLVAGAARTSVTVWCSVVAKGAVASVVSGPVLAQAVAPSRSVALETPVVGRPVLALTVASRSVAVRASVVDGPVFAWAVASGRSVAVRASVVRGPVFARAVAPGTPVVRRAVLAWSSGPVTARGAFLRGPVVAGAIVLRAAAGRDVFPPPPGRPPGAGLRP